jgi:hypothetical protein
VTEPGRGKLFRASFPQLSAAVNTPQSNILFRQDNDAGTSNAWLLHGRGLERLIRDPIVATSTVSFSTLMPAPVDDGPGSNILRSVVEHVFMPPKLPQKDPGEQIEQNVNVALCNNLIEAAQGFLQGLPSSQSSLWMRMIKMMDLACCAAAAPYGEEGLRRTLLDMAAGGTSI